MDEYKAKLMKDCIVSFVDFSDIRHAIEVQADSMYEAATALEAIQEHDCSPCIGTELGVQVRRYSGIPAVCCQLMLSVTCERPSLTA